GRPAANSLFVLTLALAPAHQGTPPRISCHARPLFPPGQRSVVFSAKRTADGILIPVRVTDSATTLWFIFDSGAARTIINRTTAGRLGLKATSHGTIPGLGAGRVPVE